MTAAPPAFRLSGLTHTYPGGKTALAGVTADLPAGATVAVLGPSGSGKSTLLSLLGLLWDGAGPDGSLVFHDGRAEHDLLKLKPPAKAALRAAAFGFVLQSNYLLPHFNCLQNVALPLALHGWPAAAREGRAAELLAADGVDPRHDLRDNRHRLPRHVSLGQRQRFAVLRALVTDPTVVFADEPSSNLDPGSTRAMFELLLRWKAGGLFPVGAACGPPRTLVLVCHDIKTAHRFGDWFLLLNQRHALEAFFPKTDWAARAGLVERVLDPEGGGP